MLLEWSTSTVPPSAWVLIYFPIAYTNYRKVTLTGLTADNASWFLLLGDDYTTSYFEVDASKEGYYLNFEWISIGY